MSKGIVNVETDRFNQLIKEFAGIEGKVPLALARAINRATQAGKTAATRQLRDEYTAKAGVINKTIKVSRATANNLTASIESRGGALRLIDFNVTPKAPTTRRSSTVKVEIRRGQRNTAKTAFVTRTRGRVGVFSRVGSPRLPIKEQFGPAVPVMLNNDNVVKAIQNRATEQLEKRIGHEINRVLGGAK